MLCGASLAAQIVVDPLPNQQPPLPTGKGAVEGVVINELTHEPVRKAQVTLTFGGVTPAVTDASGRFVFRNLPPGNYQVQAQHPEFPQPMSSPPPAVMVALAEDEQKRDIVIPLSPGASVSGRVLDEDGKPLAGCFIEALYSQAGPAGKRLNSQRGVSADDRGHYRLYGLSKGHYYFFTQCQREIPGPHPFVRRGSHTDVPELIYAPAFYPGSPNLSGAARVMLNAGADLRGFDFQMRVISAVAVHGSLTGDSEALNHNLNVQLISRDASLSNILRYGGELNQQTRTFRIGRVPPGAYTLVATAQDNNLAHLAKAPVDIGTRPPEPIELALVKGAEWSGSIEIGGDPPPALENLQVRLSPLDPDFTGQWPNAKVEKDGTFSLAGVMPGRWRLTVDGLPGYVKSLSLGDQQVSPYDFNVAPGASGTLRVMVSTKTAKVDGAVSGFRPEAIAVSGFRPAVNNVWVILMPEDPARASAARVWNVNSDGHFEVGGVEPGAYRLYAVFGVEPWALQQNTQILKAFEGRGTRVDLEEDGRATAQVEIIPAEDLKRALQEDE